MPKPRRPAFDRFMEKIVVDPETGCWNWQAQLSRAGYGRFQTGDGMVEAHRWAYEHFVGPRTPGRHIHHTCENKRCANPDHLKEVTPRENLHASDTPNRRNAAKTHCLHGHPFDEGNTYVSATGKRWCKKCRCLRMKKVRGRKVARV